MKRVVITLAAAILASSTTSPREYESLSDMFHKSREITAEKDVIVCDTPVVPTNKGAIYDSHLIASVYTPNYQEEIFVIDLETGETKNKLLPRGRGRNEAINAYLVGMQRDNIVCMDEPSSAIIKLSFDQAFKPAADQNWQKMDLECDGIFGTVSVASNSDYFYLLHSQKKYSEISMPDDLATNTILVFSKNGKPIEKITLDRGVTNIYYNQDNNSLYSLVETEENTSILRYEL